MSRRWVLPDLGVDYISLGLTKMVQRLIVVTEVVMDTTPPPADRPRVPPGIGRCSFEAPAEVFFIIVKSEHELIHMRRRLS